jgi:hypothetical protein
MHRYTTTILLAAAFVVSLAALASGWRLPGNNQGYAPAQPIAFSHKLHAGDMQISCVYCHSGAGRSRFAGIPASSICMNCHISVTASSEAVARERREAQQQNRASNDVTSAELKKLYDALALDDTFIPIEGKAPKPIAWRKVHLLPDFVYFNHSAHITAGVRCQHCHGPVESMERVRQFSTLEMGWCVNCHREATRTGIAGKQVHASIDCVTCHY